MAYKDPEKQREYQREQMRKRRAVIPQSITESPVIPVQLSPTEPYDPQAALKHMMSMHPVYSPFIRTTPHGISYHPIEGWIPGEPFRYEPPVVVVDAAKRARLKKVIKDMELVKVA